VIARMAAPILFALVLVLQLLLPGRWVTGYAIDPASGARLRYRLNGLLTFVVVIALWALACSRGWLAWDALWSRRVETAIGACASGLAFTLAMMRAGRPANPQWGAGRVDAKMFLYLAGAILLELNVLSFAAHHLIAHAQDPSPGVLLYAVLLSFFVIEYLTFEEVHLYTYDFVAERVGFKLGWGCLCFYPTFYCIGLWWVAERGNPHAPLWLEALALVLFFKGWVLSRGANLQKFYFKLRARDRQQLLASGFWRLSRHINYLGEILMALGLALVLGWPRAIGPWLYPLYYVALLIPRQLDDDKRCAAKYGERWQEYCRQVPWRILPWIY
jgi:delta14-sterol reductase